MFDKLSVNDKRIVQPILLGLIAFFSLISFVGVVHPVSGLIIIFFLAFLIIASYLLFLNMNKSTNIKKLQYYKLFLIAMYVTYCSAIVLWIFVLFHTISYFVLIASGAYLYTYQVSLAFYLISGLSTFFGAITGLGLFLWMTWRMSRLREIPYYKKFRKSKNKKSKNDEEEAVLVHDDEDEMNFKK